MTEPSLVPIHTKPSSQGRGQPQAPADAQSWPCSVYCGLMAPLAPTANTAACPDDPLSPICALPLTIATVPRTPGCSPCSSPFALSLCGCNVLGIGVSLRGAGAKLSAICLSPVRQLLEIQAQYHRQSLGSLDSALAELKESHSQTGTHWLSTQPRESHGQAWGMRVSPARLGKMGFSLPAPAAASHIGLVGRGPQPEAGWGCCLPCLCLHPASPDLE